MREGQATAWFSSLIRVGLPDRRLSRGSSWSFFERAISIIIPPGHPRHLSFGLLRSFLLPYFHFHFHVYSY